MNNQAFTRICRFFILTTAFLFIGFQSLLAESALVSWSANSESDLLGYKIYYGTSAGSYSTVIDVGNVIEFRVADLTEGSTYYFVVTAYDTAYNESSYSDEVFLTIATSNPDPPNTTGGGELTTAPVVSDVVFINPESIRVYFSQPMDLISTTNKQHYQITPERTVISMELDPTLHFVTLTTSSHDIETDYSLAIEHVTNISSIPIAQRFTQSYRYSDNVPPFVTGIELIDLATIKVAFNEVMSPASVTTVGNYAISPSVAIDSVEFGSDQKYVILHTESHSAASSYSLTVQNVSDSRGNAMSVAFSSNYSFAHHVAPAINEVTAVDRQKLTVSFSKQMDFNSITDKQNYSISPNVTIHNATSDDNLRIVTLLTDRHESGVSYELTISGVKDISQAALAQPFSFQYEFTDVLAPQLDRFVLETRRQLKINFSEAMNPASLADINNYTIRPDVAIDSVAFDASYREATLFTSEHHYDVWYQVSFGLLTDQAGNLLTAPAKRYVFNGPVAVDALSQSSYETAQLSVGDQYFVDRPYRLVTVPPALQEVTWVRTANDDKFSAVTSFLSFEVDKASIVFVAYDERLSQVPSWLSDWELTAFVISDDADNDYRCYSKRFEPGTITLGGNYGSDNSNMFLVLLKASESSTVEDLNVITGISDVPSTYILDQNYPNPFNGFTQIRFEAQQPGPAKLFIYDILGRLVQRLEIDVPSAGKFYFIWDGRNREDRVVSSGVYLYTMKKGNTLETKKMTILR